MRSVFTKILLWCFGTLLIALAAYVFISAGFSHRISGKGGPFERTIAFQADEAEENYRARGPAALGAFLRRLHSHFGPDHYLTDLNGKDLVTGVDRSELLAQTKGEFNVPHDVSGRFILVAPTTDGMYRMIAVGRPPPFNIWSFLPYYLLILLVVVLLCWILAINIVSPLRELARIVERFGRGDLSARVSSSRRDEIGDLTRAFDQMADRTETLLTAERRLLQDISHELRSPLARLSFAAELTRTAEDRNAAAGRLKKEIERLTDLVSSLLEVTRVEGDPGSRALEDLDLDPLVRELVEASRVEADARSCCVSLEANGSLPIRGDRELLRRAIENILRNAIRYAPEASPIDVTLLLAGSRAVFSVRDYGPGVPDEMLAKIFQPFFRADHSRDSHTGGVGLGLAIAYRAVTAHHGSLKAENAGPGLRVWLELPLRTPDPQT
ncbi:MAG: HAMP domain-containing sensor histidine kinase [Bryobacteraceae bacterium]